MKKAFIIIWMTLATLVALFGAIQFGRLVYDRYLHGGRATSSLSFFPFVQQTATPVAPSKPAPPLYELIEMPGGYIVLNVDNHHDVRVFFKSDLTEIEKGLNRDVTSSPPPLYKGTDADLLPTKQRRR